jgi:myo-inositol-1(or 4)-monophosphatase
MSDATLAPPAGLERPFRHERSVAIKAARAAGAAIRDLYAKVLDGSLRTSGNPSALARQASRQILLERLRGTFPADGLISDQDALIPTADLEARTWLVDPLDGEQEFVMGVPDFVVTVALIEAGRPILSVVYNPINDLLVTATRGGGVSGGPRPETTRHATDLGRAVVLASRREVLRGAWAPFGDAFVVTPTGSAAYRLALVAFGMADATVSLDAMPALDACAGAFLVEEAGGRVSGLDGGALDLSRPGARIAGLIASQEPTYAALLAVVSAVVGARAIDPGRPAVASAVVAAAVAGPAPGPATSPRVAPRITRPDPAPASFVIASPTPDPTERPQHVLRTSFIYALLVILGILLGVVAAGLTLDARAGTNTGPAATTSSDGLAIEPSSTDPSAPAGLLAAPSQGATPSPASTLALTSALALAPAVAALGDRLTTHGIELDLAWQSPTDGSPVSGYDLEISGDGGSFRPVALSRKTSRKATIAIAADHTYVVRVRARAKDGTPGTYVDAPVRLAQVEESGPQVRASPGWRTAKHPAYSGGRARYATAAGAMLSMPFEGSGVAIIGPKGPGRGRAEVIIDGQRVGRLDAIADVFRPVRLLIAVDGLNPGPHILTVRVAGTGGRPMVAIDRFLILGQP